ncbi:MAG: TM0106 family RecB-like putative nuclease [Spirulinaceae cyanobacterium RM2_2_10]|nr:TM0106 family RecB-like putative nuclease [Spirulinaceae cyanobacterium RM2_2_10]
MPILLYYGVWGVSTTFSPASPAVGAESCPRMLLTDDLLLAYKRCDRRFFLNLWGDRRQQDPEREFIQKLRQENQQQINDLLTNYDWVRPEYPRGDWAAGAAVTAALMAAGASCVYRGVLLGTGKALSADATLEFLGRPTFLVKQPGRSRWGDWSYQPVNVKLGKRPKPEYKLVTTLHAELLEQLQGAPVVSPELVLREQQVYRVIWRTGSRVCGQRSPNVSKSEPPPPLQKCSFRASGAAFANG